MPVYTYHINTEGDAGNATGSVTMDIDLPMALVDCIKVDYGETAPGTTDLTVEEAEGLKRTILTLADTATDAEKYPRHTLHDDEGADIAGMVDYYVVNGPLKISIAGCDELTPAATVTISVLVGEAMR